MRLGSKAYQRHCEVALIDRCWGLILTMTTARRVSEYKLLSQPEHGYAYKLMLSGQ